MAISQKPLLTDGFLRSVWDADFQRFKNSGEESALTASLENWASRRDLGETASEAPFINTFFSSIWGYSGSGETATGSFTYRQQFPVEGSGQDGGTGRADLALGYFTGDNAHDIPQVLAEFKGVRGMLDTPQKRAGKVGNRTPVEQARDYVWGARRGLYGNEDIIPEWAIVTNMREFRLYWYDRMPHEAMSFTLGGDLFDQDRNLLGPDDEARFRRFIFSRVFHADFLLGTSGGAKLRRLIAQQGAKQKKLEEDFYFEYRAMREKLYYALAAHNSDFKGTKGRLLRLAQRILDRIIFILYCEDRGAVIGFPPQLLRDQIKSENRQLSFDESTDDIWRKVSRLFRTMNTGGEYGKGVKVSRFNGGLFAGDPEIEALYVPNYIFCVAHQSDNVASTEAAKETIFYFADRYDFSSTGAGQGLDLYTLGRIFEQSITELEIREAELDERPSIGKISKRKRDGVYYTPERIVRAIIAETAGPRFDELKTEAGWIDGLPSDLAKLEAYDAALWKLRLVDPACGSGAFLVTALRYFADEHIRVESLRVSLGAKERPDVLLRIMDRLLAECIYGVDINPSSVEIAKLALWLHSARRGEPLSSLDKTLRDGNSLVSERFYDADRLAVYAEEARERVNAFNWEKQFPDAFANGGFDFVVGNPPYVKLQNFRQVHSDMAEFLRNGRGGHKEYQSTQSGNFDLYLPFIEKGVALLNEKGRMGYIAPSLWLVNEYGEALRKEMLKTRQLDRWVDFKSFQIFEEATTYTSLQFFSKASNDSVRFIDAPDGVLAQLDWSDPCQSVPYDELADTENWSLLACDERAFVARMAGAHMRLDDKRVTKAIFVGVQTSADSIYHLKRLGPGVYQHEPNPAERKQGQAPYEVALEDAVMKPLISGSEAKRFVEPETETYILLPYRADKPGQLYSMAEMQSAFPRALAYLKSWEEQLRARESNSFNDDAWYRFGRHQNLDKQHLPKLLVPRLVENLGGFLDAAGTFCLDNVDVGGVLPANPSDGPFLLTILNCAVTDFIFRRKSKPFRGDYRSANKQFIAHLPIPRPDQHLVLSIAACGERLQALHTSRRNTLRDAERRLGALGRETKPWDWLFPGLSETERDAALARIQLTLARRIELAATLERGELRLTTNTRPLIERVFVSEQESALALAAWQYLARAQAVSDKTKAKDLAAKLRSIPLRNNSAAADQFTAAMREAALLEQTIRSAEDEANALIYAAYGLTPDEQTMIEADRGPVFGTV